MIKTWILLPRGRGTIAAQDECAAAADLIVREHSAASNTPPPPSSLTNHMYCGLASPMAAQDAKYPLSNTTYKINK